MKNINYFCKKLYQNYTNKFKLSHYVNQKKIII